MGSNTKLYCKLNFRVFNFRELYRSRNILMHSKKYQLYGIAYIADTQKIRFPLLYTEH